MVMFLLINCLLLITLFKGVLRLVQFWYTVLSVLSSFAIVLMGERELVALLKLSSG